MCSGIQERGKIDLGKRKTRRKLRNCWVVPSGRSLIKLPSTCSTSQLLSSWQQQEEEEGTCLGPWLPSPWSSSPPACLMAHLPHLLSLNTFRMDASLLGCASSSCSWRFNTNEPVHILSWYIRMTRQRRHEPLRPCPFSLTCRYTWIFCPHRAWNDKKSNSGFTVVRRHFFFFNGFTEISVHMRHYMNKLCSTPTETIIF